MNAQRGCTLTSSPHLMLLSKTNDDGYRSNENLPDFKSL